jgi:hypothetical protein
LRGSGAPLGGHGNVQTEPDDHHQFGRGNLRENVASFPMLVGRRSATGGRRADTGLTSVPATPRATRDVADRGADGRRYARARRRRSAPAIPSAACTLVLREQHRAVMSSTAAASASRSAVVKPVCSTTQYMSPQLHRPRADDANPGRLAFGLIVRVPQLED